MLVFLSLCFFKRGCRNQFFPGFSQTTQIKKRGEMRLSICYGHSGFPSMLEQLIADCLKVLSLSFALMSCSSEVRLNLLSQFMIGLSKVQSGCLDGLFEELRRREGPDVGPEVFFLSHFESIFLDFEPLHFGQLPNLGHLLSQFIVRVKFCIDQ